MSLDLLKISEERASRLTAFITGCTVALGTTTLFFSLTTDVKSGYELAFADFLLPVALFMGYRFRLLVFPSLTVLLLTAVVLLSSISLIATFSAVYFAVIILSLSMLRIPITQHKKEFYFPLLLIISLSLPVAIFWQSITLHHHRLWGLHGAVNPAGGVAAFVALLVPGTVILIPILMLGLTASRAGALGLLVGALMLGRAKWRLVLFILLGELAVLGVITGVSALIGKENTLETSNESRFYLPSSQPLERFLPTEILEELRLGLRIKQMQNSLEDTRFWPNGFGAGTRYEITNPHNIYLILWNSLGWILGSVAIISLLYLLVRSKEPLLACVLAAGLFDHIWVTTPIGIYLLATALAFASVRLTKNMKRTQWLSV